MRARSDVNFLKPSTSRRLGWAVFALGASSLVVSSLIVHRLQHDRRDAAEMRQGLEARARELSASRTPKPPSLAERRSHQAELELSRPWLPVLSAVENHTSAPIFLLSFSVNPATGIINLEGEAPSFDHALAYVHMLDSTGALAPAIMTSHERQGDLPSVRFSATSRWVMP